MAAGKLPNTYKQFCQFIDRQIHLEDLSEAIDNAHFAYEQARATRLDLHRQLAEHDAKRPAAYSYRWSKVRGQIITSLLTHIELLEQSRIDLDKAECALWHARRAVVAQLRTPEIL